MSDLIKGEKIEYSDLSIGQKSALLSEMKRRLVKGDWFPDYLIALRNAVNKIESGVAVDLSLRFVAGGDEVYDIFHVGGFPVTTKRAK